MSSADWSNQVTEDSTSRLDCWSVVSVPDSADKECGAGLDDWFESCPVGFAMSGNVSGSRPYASRTALAI